jgi:ribonuclease Z
MLLTYKSEGILVDCGEGTQRQMKIAGIPLTKVTKILITHWHGDHVLGLPGLIQSLGASEYHKTLEIYGPLGTRKHLSSLLGGIEFDFRIKVKVVEVEKGLFFENKDFTLECLPLVHRVRCVAYAFVEQPRRKIHMDKVKQLGIPEGPLVGELQDGHTIVWKGKKVVPEDVSSVVKGRKIAFILDTLLTDNCFRIAQDADALVCESSYARDLKDKAQEYKHLTAEDAGLIASKANVKKLVLCHFSARYKNTLQIEEDARTMFDNVVCANDFMRLTL